MPHLSGQHELTAAGWGFPIPPVTVSYPRPWDMRMGIDVGKSKTGTWRR